MTKKRFVVDIDESLASSLRDSGQIEIVSSDWDEAEFAWESHAASSPLHGSFSRLSRRDANSNVIATILQDVEIKLDHYFHWIVFSATEEARQKNIEANVYGTASTLELAKRQCEAALGLGVCADRENRA